MRRPDPCLGENGSNEMSLYDFKKKVRANFKETNKGKYLFYFIVVIMFFIYLGVQKRDTSLTTFPVFSTFAFFGLVVIIDLVFDLLGYFKKREHTRKISFVKNILGYIVGTIIFAFILHVLVKVVDFLATG